MTGVSWNSAVETASSVPGFQGTNGPGIGSWFHTASYLYVFSSLVDGFENLVYITGQY